MLRSSQAVEHAISFGPDGQIWMHARSPQALVIGSHDRIALCQPCVEIRDIALRPAPPGWRTNVSDPDGAVRPSYDGPTSARRRTLWEEHGSRHRNRRFAV